METKTPITPEMYAALKKPLPAKAVTKHPTKTYLSSIKAIYVVERLNEVFGVGMWKVQNKVIREDSKHIVVKSVLTFESHIGYFEAYGGNDNADLGDAYKGACTDALTKIGSYLGVAMEVYKGEGNTEKPEPVLTKAAPKPEPVPTKPAAKTDPGEATSKQKEDIIRLLNNPVITQPEKTKMLLNLNKLNQERAAEAISKLTKVINERQTQAA
jgi:hypothetical protein